MARWQAANPERNRELKKKWEDKNREKIRDAKMARYYENPSRHRAWALANPDRMRAHGRKSYLKTKFSITQEQFVKMFEGQDGKCAICKTDKPGKRGFHIDHDHETGVIRKLLCRACNNGLGCFSDSPEKLYSAINYLVAHGKAALNSTPA